MQSAGTDDGITFIAAVKTSCNGTGKRCSTCTERRNDGRRGTSVTIGHALKCFVRVPVIKETGRRRFFSTWTWSLREEVGFFAVCGIMSVSQIHSPKKMYRYLTGSQTRHSKQKRRRYRGIFKNKCLHSEPATQRREPIWRSRLHWTKSHRVKEQAQLERSKITNTAAFGKHRYFKRFPSCLRGYRVLIRYFFCQWGEHCHKSHTTTFMFLKK